MKKIYLLSTCFALLFTLLFSGSLLSQEAVVGTLKKGQPVLTSLTNATLVLSGGQIAAAVDGER